MSFRIALLGLVLILNTINYSAHGQAQVQWGPDYKIKGGADLFKFLGILDDGYYFVVDPNDDNIVQYFSMDHELLSEKKYDYVRNGQRLKIHGAVRTASGSYIYSHLYSKKYKEWVIQASRVQGGVIAEPQEIYFQQFDISNSRMNKAYRNFEYDFGSVYGGIIMSEDSTRLAFVNLIPGDDFKGKDAIAVVVFDSELKMLWKDVFYFDFGDSRYGIDQMVVSNEGEIYLVGTKDKDERDEKEKRQRKKENDKKLPNYDYYLYHINEEGVLESRVDLGAGKAPVEVALFFPDSYTDQFLLAGFYTDDEFRNRLQGIFFSYGHESFAEDKTKLHEFTTDFLLGLVSDNQIKKGKGLESSYRIKDIINYRDGSIGFIAENSYMRDFSQTDMYGRWYNRRVFVTDEIILPKFDYEGNLLNIQKITKDFSSEFRPYTSYAMAVHNGLTYLLFNDYKSGAERREIKRSGSRFTDLVVLDEWGRFVGVQTLFTDREIAFEFNPELCDYNQKYFLIGSKQGNRFSMATLEFDQ